MEMRGTPADNISKKDIDFFRIMMYICQVAKSSVALYGV